MKKEEVEQMIGKILKSIELQKEVNAVVKTDVSDWWIINDFNDFKEICNVLGIEYRVADITVRKSGRMYHLVTQYKGLELVNFLIVNGVQK